MKNFLAIATLVFLLIPTLTFSDILPYDRNAFGRWIDKDRDCRDTRAEILIDESYTPVIMDERGCRVISGTWVDFFTFEIITDASLVDIDHLVPVYEAWIRGAYAWTREERVYFFNDRTNLVVTHQSNNRSKGNRSPDQWRPYDIQNACGFALRWLEVKTKYELAVTRQEHEYLRIMIGLCIHEMPLVGDR